MKAAPAYPRTFHPIRLDYFACRHDRRTIKRFGLARFQAAMLRYTQIGDAAYTRIGREQPRSIAPLMRALIFPAAYFDELLAGDGRRNRVGNRR